MNRLMSWWVLMAVVLALDVVTVVFHPLPRLLEGAVVALLTGVLVVFVLLRLIELKQMREHQRAAWEHLEAVRRARRGDAA